MQLLFCTSPLHCPHPPPSSLLSSLSFSLFQPRKARWSTRRVPSLQLCIPCGKATPPHTTSPPTGMTCILRDCVEAGGRARGVAVPSITQRDPQGHASPMGLSASLHYKLRYLLRIDYLLILSFAASARLAATAIRSSARSCWSVCSYWQQRHNAIHNNPLPPAPNSLSSASHCLGIKSIERKRMES